MWSCRTTFRVYYVPGRKIQARVHISVQRTSLLCEYMYIYVQQRMKTKSANAAQCRRNRVSSVCDETALERESCNKTISIVLHKPGCTLPSLKGVRNLRIHGAKSSSRSRILWRAARETQVTKERNGDRDESAISDDHKRCAPERARVCLSMCWNSASN